jgi:hypothetical protein
LYDLHPNAIISAMNLLAATLTAGTLRMKPVIDPAIK